MLIDKLRQQSLRQDSRDQPIMLIALDVEAKRGISPMRVKQIAFVLCRNEDISKAEPSPQAVRYNITWPDSLGGSASPPLQRSPQAGSLESLCLKEANRRIYRLINDVICEGYRPVVITWDARMERQYLSEAGLGEAYEHIKVAILDLSAVDAIQRGTIRRRKLEVACREAGLPSVTYHEAGNDATQVLKLMRATILQLARSP